MDDDQNIFEPYRDWSDNQLHGCVALLITLAIVVIIMGFVYLLVRELMGRS